MTKVYAMIADGTEEVECIAVVDILRRANIDVTLVSVGGRTVTCSHSVKVTADAAVGELDLASADLIFLPGGMPGSKNLAACAPLIKAIGEILRRGGTVAAICAAPAVVLGANGFLRGKKATCYPGFEDGLVGATPMRSARVVTDGNIITARGPGCAIELGLEIVGRLCGYHTADEIKDSIQF